MKDLESNLKQPKNRFIGSCRPFTVFLSVLILATQILVILNIRNYYLNKQAGFSEEFSVKISENVKNSENKKHVKKPVRLDVARFEIEVVKPHKDMRAKFPKHPDMVIQKLSKLLEKERNRYGLMFHTYFVNVL